MTRYIPIAALLCFAFTGNDVHAQPLSRFLDEMPQPPVVAVEAVGRCPGEVDTLVQNAMRMVNAMRLQEKEKFRSDSMQIKTSQSFDAASRQRELQEIGGNVRKRNAEVGTRVAAITRMTSQRLFTSVREIGDRLDAEITSCPKVGPPKAQRYDSSCVASAEERARISRLHAVDLFLSEIQEQWQPMIDSLARDFAQDESMLMRLKQSTKNHGELMRLREIHLTDFQLIETLLTTSDQISRLAAQFAR